MKSRVRVLIAATILAAPSLLVAQDKSAQLHEVMAKSMHEMQSMPMSGDVDVDFAMMMKHHHKSGIEMARVQARNGKDPEMRAQAQKIIESQQKEISELDRWLKSKGKAATGSGASGSSGHSGHGSK